MSECKIWTGPKFHDGYGQCYKWYKGKLIVRAHVWAWAKKNKRLPPKGMEVAHLCHVRSCYEPDHLELQTHQENLTSRQCGKLLEEEVLEIRKIYKEGAFTQEQLAKKFGVDRATVSYIVNRKSWKNV